MERRQDRLALIECLERDGHAARVVDVAAWPLTIGRALDNHLVIDDPHVAAHHARLQAVAEGGIELEVLQTRNGVVLDGRALAAGARAPVPAAGATLQLGGGTLRLRLPGEELAEEKPLPALARGRALRTAAAGVGFLALAAAGHALALDPGADATAWLPTLVGVPGVVAGWCGLWALMSKLFQRRFDFAGHLRIVLPWLLGMQLVESFLPQLAAALGWPALWQAAAPLQMAMAALMVHAQLVHLLPLHRRAVTSAVALGVVAGTAITLGITWRATDSLTRAPYMSTLPLPALNWARTGTAAALVQDMAPLAQQIAERVRKAQAEEAADGGDAD